MTAHEPEILHFVQDDKELQSEDALQHRKVDLQGDES